MMNFFKKERFFFGRLLRIKDPPPLENFLEQHEIGPVDGPNCIETYEQLKSIQKLASKTSVSIANCLANNGLEEGESVC